MVFDWVADQVFRLTGDRLKPKPFDPVTGFGEAPGPAILPLSCCDVPLRAQLHAIATLACCFW